MKTREILQEVADFLNQLIREPEKNLHAKLLNEEDLESPIQICRENGAVLYIIPQEVYWDFKNSKTKSDKLIAMQGLADEDLWLTEEPSEEFLQAAQETDDVMLMPKSLEDLDEDR